jgi:transcriptional regulator with XRE-family HTH domain
VSAVDRRAGANNRSTRLPPVEGVYRFAGRLIREFRIDADLSQQDLAAMIGFSRTSLVNVEKGRQRIMLHHLQAIAKALHVPLYRFMP